MRFEIDVGHTIESDENEWFIERPGQPSVRAPTLTEAIGVVKDQLYRESDADGLEDTNAAIEAIDAKLALAIPATILTGL